MQFIQRCKKSENVLRSKPSLGTPRRTKKRYIWRFVLDEKEHAIELYNSSLSGKKKILHNGRNIYEKRKYDRLPPAR